MIRSSTFTDKWPIVKLGDVVNFLDHKRIPVTKSDRIPGEYQYYGANGSQGTINDYIFDEPLVLVAEDGGNFGNPDRTIAYIAEGKYWVNNHAHVLQPKEGLDLNYLCRVLEKYDVTPYVKGATRQKLSKTDASRIPIPLPPLETQKQIAAVLEKADQLRKDCQQMEQELNSLAQSVFIDMFGDPVTNPKGWKPRLLKEFYISDKLGTKCGPFGSALKKNEFAESGVPVWNMDNISLNGKFVDGASLWITKEKFKDLEAYSVEQGDVIISRAGTVGKMGVVNSAFSKSIISTNLIRVRFGSKLHPLYFVSLMTYCKTRLKRLKVGDDGSFSHMNTGILDALEFPYPPVEEQFKYVEFREQLDTQLALLQGLKSEYEQSFNSLMQRAFKGELKLKPSNTQAA